MAIFGGRNNNLYSEVEDNVALNDLHLNDLVRNTWVTVAIYGNIPLSRWGHQLFSCNTTSKLENKLFLFGGVNLHSYCNSTIFEFNFGKKTFKLIDYDLNLYL